MKQVLSQAEIEALFRELREEAKDYQSHPSMDEQRIWSSTVNQGTVNPVSSTGGGTMKPAGWIGARAKKSAARGGPGGGGARRGVLK